MAERLGEALLDLDTRDTRFNAGIDRAEKKARGLGIQFDLTAAKAAKMGRNLALAAAAGTAALGVLVKKQIDHADAMSKAAASAGVTTESLSRLAWAGDLSDVALEELTSSIFRLSNAMAQAASGKDKDLAAIFTGLGVALTDAQGRLRAADAVMMDLADVFAALENGADKTALAVKIFGRSGAQLIPLLNNGRKGLADMGAEADRLGLTISTKLGQDAELFNDTLTRIQAMMRGIVIQIAGDMLPVLQSFADKLADPAFREEARAMAQDVAGAFGTIADAIRTVVDLIDQVGAGWSKLKGWVDWANTHDMFGNKIAPAFKGPLDLDPGKGDRGALPANPMAGRFADTFGAAGINAGREPRPTAPAAVPPSITRLLGGAGGGAAAGELERQRQAVTDLIAALEDELDVLRETDPVQREMIRLRGALAAATPEQTDQVRALVEATMSEREQLYALQDAFQAFGDMAVDAFDRLLDGSEDLDDVLGDLAKSLRRMVLQAALLGQGPLGNMFGAGAKDGGIGGILGSVFSSVFAGFRAKGGLIPNGTFGIVGEKGPEPVIGTSRGAMVLPNSALKAMDARAGGGSFNFSQTITPPDGFEARTRESDAPGGKRQEVWFEEAVGSAISRRGSAQSAVRNVGRLTKR
ncbi:hypothetical protein [Polymorphum gilvum]|uniref:Tail length tape measure protein n=1 Tax=Polymorphum gilvum (strain LMG 25793 / CGMCC 1.9160 / SL003B-26A1) TaxID=991905 RepID=F2J5P2_POLGS|nr:hypothetical protein [Polymorphum gilvum]ADZ70126.1 Tail length tape measure protein [Polymorphum gilvum SL003B-26A1]